MLIFCCKLAHLTVGSITTVALITTVAKVWERSLHSSPKPLSSGKERRPDTREWQKSSLTLLHAYLSQSLRFLGGVSWWWWSNISNSEDCFRPQFQHFNVFEKYVQTRSQVFDISSQLKLKLRRNEERKSFRNYAHPIKDIISLFF